MSSTIKLLPYNTADALIDSSAGAASATSLYGLANAGYAYSGEIDNTTGLYTLGDIELALSSAVTSVAPATLAVFLLPNVGSGNYVASSGSPGGSYQVGTFAGPGGSLQYLQVRGVELPSKFKVVIQNNLGVALPSAVGSTLKLYRYGYQVV